jgi:arylsulfatase A-like enzyme
MRLLFLFLLLSCTLNAADRPNILWLTFEDSSPHLGCYGDKQAVTPHLDALARRGMKYATAWSNAPVCAPARTCIVTGRWAPSDGAEHMRSEVPLPQGHKLGPQLLREAGYYCTNQEKEDYNLTLKEQVWDESSKKAHWKNRQAGQPFFAVFNFTRTHESQIRAGKKKLQHDPALVEVPPYMPDTPEVRRDWAAHFDNVTAVDGMIGAKLAEIEQAGLAEDTIVFAYSDHGTGMIRSKRWAQSSGLRVPFIACFPEKWKHLAPKDYAVNSTSPQLIQFMDLAPTVLSLAGLKAPAYMHGRAFAGEHQQSAWNYLYGFRGRMDERPDMVRSVTDGRYVYVRHFMPHLPEAPQLAYMFEQASTVAWYAEHTAGKLSALHDRIWQPKPTELLYDLQTDPYETQDLASSQQHAEVKAKLRAALEQWLVQTRDLGCVPEVERLVQAAGQSPADHFNQDFPLAEVLAAALSATDRTVQPAVQLLTVKHAASRYWGCMSLRVHGLPKQHVDAVVPLLADPSAAVRVAAAELLVRAESTELQAKAWQTLLKSADGNTCSCMESNEALNVIDELGELAKPQLAALRQVDAKKTGSWPKRYQGYPGRVWNDMLKKLGL